MRHVKIKYLSRPAALMCIWLGAVSAQAATPGSVLAWGRNEHGETTVPFAAQSGVIATDGGGLHTVALKIDGSVVAWGNNSYGQTSVPVAAQSGVTGIVAGTYHTVALKANGSLVTWGNNSSGQTTVPVAAQSGVTAIAAGGDHTVALKNDGSILAWGNNYSGQTTVPVAAQSAVTAIAAGGSCTVALKSDGSVVAWGNNFYGQTTVPVAARSGVTAIAAGGDHTVALKNDGSVVAWGRNDYGQTTVPVAARSDVTAIAAGYYHTVALKNDGTVVAWGNDYAGQQTSVPVGLRNVTAIAAGGSHTVAIGPLMIVVHPFSQTWNVGQNATFSVVAIGGAPLSYQWSKNGVSITGATNATFIIPAVAESDAGNYFVVVSNSAGSNMSSTAALTVVDSPIFTTQPLSQTVGVGGSATMSATAYGAQPLVFQWYFNNSPVGSPGSGGNVSFYTVTNARTDNVGNYSVQVFNGYGSAMSSTASLTVVDSLIFTTQPLSQRVGVGGSVTLSAMASGAQPLSFQWYFNSSPIGSPSSGGNVSFYTVTDAQTDSAGNYSVEVFNDYGSAVSSVAVLTVVARPVLGLQLLGGYPLLKLSGELGGNFTVQYTTNLSATNWIELRSISNLSANPFQFLDPAGSSAPARCYRAVMQ